MVGIDQDFAGAYWAIVGYRTHVRFMFDLLNMGDFVALDLQRFFARNPVFPSVCGGTPSEALILLDRKLGMLYDFHRSGASGCHGLWNATRRFALRAEYDPEPDEPGTTYEVQWHDILDDLSDAYRVAEKAGDLHWYDQAERQASTTHYRDLYALLNVTYQLPEPVG